MADRTVRVRLQAEIASYLAGLRTASAATREFGREVSGLGRATSVDVERVGRTALVMGGAVAAATGLAIKAAVDWESAWAGVTKTVDGTAQQMAQLEEGLRRMATELPATHQEIAAVAEAAGALGIETGAIEKFTRVMLDLGETTNVTADQAATSFAQIANIMGTASQDFDRLGSVLVALGNDGASTESEILELANRMAAAGRIAGLTESDLFGLASAVASVGIEAEAGGTALSRVLTTMSDAVLDGTDDLRTFARVAGVSVQEFSRVFREDAGDALALFIEGLGRTIERGESLTPILEELSFTDIRLSNAVKSLAGSQGLLVHALELGERAWEENNALQTEAEKRYATTAAQLEIFHNRVNNAAVDLGRVFLPGINAVVGALGDAAIGLGELPGPLDAVAAGFAALTAAGLTAVGLLGTLGPKVRAARDALMSMGSVGQFVGRNLGRMALAAGAVGVALFGLSLALGRQAERQREAEEAARGFTDAIREQGAAIGELSRQRIAEGLLDGDLGSALRGASADIATFILAVEGGVNRSQRFWEAIRNSSEDVRRSLRELGYETEGVRYELLQVTLGLHQMGLAGTAAGDEILRLVSAGELTKEQAAQLVERMEEQSTAFARGAEQAENLAAAEAAVTEATGELADAVDELDARNAVEFVEIVSDALDELVADVERTIPTLGGLLDEVLAEDEQNRRRVADDIRDRADEQIRALREANEDISEEVIRGIEERAEREAEAIEAGAHVTAGALAAKLAEEAALLADFREDLTAITEAGFAEVAAMLARLGEETGGALADEIVEEMAAGNTALLENLSAAADAFQSEWRSMEEFLRTELGPQMIIQAGLLGQGLLDSFGEGLTTEQRLAIYNAIDALGETLDTEGQAIAVIAAAEGEGAAQAYGEALDLAQEVIDAGIAAARAIRDSVPVDQWRARAQIEAHAYAEAWREAFAHEFGGGLGNPQKFPIRGENIRKYATGGIVSGPQLPPHLRVGSDSVPALLTPGEAVLNVDAARALGASTIDALNSGRTLDELRLVAAGGGSAWSDAQIIAELQRLRSDLSAQVRSMRPINIPVTGAERSAREIAHEVSTLLAVTV